MNSMSDRFFIDTNVLVYAYDRADPSKMERAMEVMDRLVVTQSGALSTQVLGEFFNAVTRRISSPLSRREARDRIRHYLHILNISSCDRHEMALNHAIWHAMMAAGGDPS
jgi:predicted nucleic acid-binding protein